MIRQLGTDGWLGIGWPEEYGGQARSMVDQLIFTDAAAVAGVPVPYLTLNTVGPTIMRYGTDEQKDYFLPRILAGELHFSIGYSEPGSGTDLASLRTRARPRGRRVGHQRPEDVDLAHPVRRLDLAGLPHRPRPAAAQGPVDDPRAGRRPRLLLHARCTPSPGVGTSATYYEDVRVPVGNLVGELNGGWALMTNQLNHERVALTSAAPLHALDRPGPALGAGDQGRPTARGSSTRSGCRSLLGRAHARTETLTLINWKLASDATSSDLSPADASATKVYGSELATEVYRSLMEVVGPERRASPATPRAPCSPAGSSASTARRW